MLKLALLSLLVGTLSAFPDILYYSRSNPSVGVNVNNGIAGTDFNVNKRTIFLIHGFAENNGGSRIQNMKEEALRLTDANVCIVDWGSGAAAPNYWAAVDNTRIVGRKLADFIVLKGLNAQNVHCIGHSLGAHCCGFAGKLLKLNRITGLDPAGPWFNGNAAADRLDKGDANYVDVIHTDDWWGYQAPCGHKDFYPNGGGSQAGCGISGIIGKRADDFVLPPLYVDDGDDTKVYYQIELFPGQRLFGFDLAGVFACSHVRVQYYLAESLNPSNSFTAVKCDTYSNFQKGNCKNNGVAKMGYFSTESSLEGNFYLDTNKQEPFSMY